MKNQKITIVFLAAILVAGAITIASPILIDDASASGDKHKKKHDRYSDDRHDKEREYDSKYSDDRHDKEREYDSKYSDDRHDKEREYDSKYSDDRHDYNYRD
jgi:hypothetical protein